MDIIGATNTTIEHISFFISRLIWLLSYFSKENLASSFRESFTILGISIVTKVVNFLILDVLKVITFPFCQISHKSYHFPFFIDIP